MQKKKKKYTRKENRRNSQAQFLHIKAKPTDRQIDRKKERKKEDERGGRKNRVLITYKFELYCTYKYMDNTSINDACNLQLSRDKKARYVDG